MRNNRGTGELVEVEGGGRIVRSLRRKDRHSKVCTSKGPRDRRLRLAANTAIQFYDVQDRLGYDRPSKAIDWLMKEAKPVIDALQNHNHDHQLLAAGLDAFHRTGEAFSHPKVGDYSMGFMDSREKMLENPIGEVTPMDFKWNQSYDPGDGFAFGDREPLQSSYSTLIHTFNDEFADDEEILGFNFQQESRVEVEENGNIVSKTRRTSGNSYQIL